MACGCKAGSRLLVEIHPGVVYGEAGLMLVQWKDSSPRLIHGDITGYPYDFREQPAMFVDERDGVYLLGGLVELV